MFTQLLNVKKKFERHFEFVINIDFRKKKYKTKNFYTFRNCAKIGLGVLRT